MTSLSISRLVLICAALALGLDAGRATDQVPARTNFGEAQIKAIQARYNATPTDCGGPTKPAMLCSGVLIRSTGDGQGYHVWNPSPGAIALNGVSFAYLRADANFAGFSPLETWAGFDGMIFSPEQAVDAATFHPTMRCAFPIDGWTTTRVQACGRSGNGGDNSAPCQTQGVYTAEQWAAKFPDHTGGSANYGYAQCGFATENVADPAAAFIATVNARRKPFLSDAQLALHNELVMKPWPANIGAKLPIEAFFYLVANGRSGLAGAQRNQRDLLQTDGMAVPVIRVDFPSTPDGRATFFYQPAEQVIPVPGLPASLDVSPSVVQAPAGTLRVQDILARQDIEVTVPALPDVGPDATGKVRWIGTRTSYISPSQPVSTDAPTVFAIPRGSVLAALGQSVRVSFVVTDRALARERASGTAAINVSADATIPASIVVAPDRGSAEVRYDNMSATDQIWVSYEGNGVHDTPFPKQTAPFNAGLVPSWFGSPDQVYYWVKRATDFLVSDVVTPTHGPWPIMADAPNAWLDFSALDSDPAVIVPPSPDMVAGQTVSLEALAYSPDGTAQKALLINHIVVDAAIAAGGLHAVLSRDWLRRLPDGSAVFLRTQVTTPGVVGTRAFPVTRVTLRNAPGPIVTKPLPQLVVTPAGGVPLPIDGLLSGSVFNGTLQARVAPWPGMSVGQRVWLRLHGWKPDGSATVIALAQGYAVTATDLAQGLIRPVPLDQLDSLGGKSPLALELKVGFEKLDDERQALTFPVNNMVFAK